LEVNLVEVIKTIRSKYPQIDFEIDGECIVFADQGLHSVFENLINNAIKHGKAKKIIICITEKDKFCQINFSDDGNGIPEEYLDRIFEEGFVYGEHGNTGIGLFIVKQTIETYGGLVFVEKKNKKGSGLNFIINLRKAMEMK
jgi:signal transduction histidine kinase